MREITRIDLSRIKSSLDSLNKKYPVNSTTAIKLEGLTVDESALLCPNPSEFYRKAYLTPNFEHFRVIVGVREATKITTALFSDEILQGVNCGWNSLGSELNAKLITPCKFNVMEEICLWDLETSFTSDLNPILSDSQVLNFMWETLSLKVNENIATTMWQGASYSTGFVCDGFEHQIEEDDDVIYATASAFTVSNIESAFETALLSLPSTVSRKKSVLRFYVSPYTANLIAIAAAKNNTSNYVTKELDLYYLGIQIVEQEGMSDNKIFLGPKDNFIYTINTAIDTNQLRVVDLRNTTNEDVIRVKLAGHLGFDIVNGDEIVYIEGI